MPQIVIDGKEIEAKQGQTVIQAAFENGINITHFCWHPELSVSGNCRMCLVEIGMPKRLPEGGFQKDENGNPVINYFPKLQIACATNAAEGMHVRTNTEKVVRAQEAVMEFLLINHPLDCPICDEAGQCKLQEYAFNHSTGESRFEENKNPSPKRQEWGPNVMYDAERCISCSRCIRFAQEIAKQDVLTFVQRGDHVTIELFDGTSFDNPYSMNVIDICPVGALTSRDFRFKSRVWDMSFNDSICPGCSRGCNIQIGVRNNEILRLEPKTNMYVNRYWMCDYGRLTQYPFVNSERITEPMKRKNGKLKAIEWDEAYKIVVEELGRFKPSEIAFVGSARATNEDNYLMRKFAMDVIKTKNIVFFKHMDEDFEDDLLRVKNMTANVRGAKEILSLDAEKGVKYSELAKALSDWKIKALYVIEEDFADKEEILEVLDSLDLLIVHASNYNKLTDRAHIVLATSTYAEIEGTYTNIEGRVQHFEPALVTKENLRIMGMKMSRLDKFGAHNDRWTHHEHRGCRQSWRSIKNLANLMEADWKYSQSADVFDEIAKLIPAFADMNYAKLDEYQGLNLNRGSNPDPKLNNYESHYMKP